MSKKRVILLSFNWANHFSLALGYLKSYALKDSFIRDTADIEILDFDTEMLNVQQVVYYLVQFKPDLIGFSCYCWNIGKVLETARIIKTVYPEIKIVLGGPEAGPIGEKYLRENPFIDFVVKGEGEITFSELLKWFARQSRLEDIQGITFRNNGQIQAKPWYRRMGFRRLVSTTHPIAMRPWPVSICGASTPMLNRGGSMGDSCCRWTPRKPM